MYPMPTYSQKEADAHTWSTFGGYNVQRNTTEVRAKEGIRRLLPRLTNVNTDEKKSSFKICIKRFYENEVGARRHWEWCEGKLTCSGMTLLFHQISFPAKAVYNAGTIIHCEQEEDTQNQTKERERKVNAMLLCTRERERVIVCVCVSIFVILTEKQALSEKETF